MRLSGIEYNKYEPKDLDVLWIKPVKGGIAFYLFDGGWKAQQLMNDMGTATTEDDTVIDVKNIPSLETLEQKIQGEVTEQISEHDVNVRDVHSQESGDDTEYPDYSDII